MRYVISKDTTSTSQSSSNDLDKVGRDDMTNNVSHLIGMH